MQSLFKGSRAVAARILTAAVCLCLIASGCGDKGDDNSAVSEKTESIVSASSTIGTDSDTATDTASKKDSDTSSDKKAESSAASSKAESKAASKSESKASAASKAESKTASKAESKAEAKPEEKTESAAESKAGSKTESKAEEKPESKAEEQKTSYKAGQTVKLDVMFAHISMNGQPAKIGAYDYWITYDESALEFVSAEPATSSDLKVVNSDDPGMVKIAHIAAYGFDDDYTGEAKPTYTVTFKVKKDADDLGISCECPSLTAVSMDGASTLPLINKANPQDKYSSFKITAE